MIMTWGNTVMITAYKEGIPGNGKPFSEGSIIVKLCWTIIRARYIP
jgi:hypothetical protein